MLAAGRRGQVRSPTDDGLPDRPGAGCTGEGDDPGPDRGSASPPTGPAPDGTAR